MRCADLRAWVQGIEGVPQIEKDFNPATWVLEVTNVAVEHRTGQDFAALYSASNMNRSAFALGLDGAISQSAVGSCRAQV